MDLFHFKRSYNIIIDFRINLFGTINFENNLYLRQQFF